MKKLHPLTLAGFAACGVLLAFKALQLAEAGITLLLMHFGGYGYGAAAARAPLYLCAGLCTLLGIGASLWGLHEENQQYKRAARKVHRTHARSPEYPALPEHSSRRDA